MSSLAEFNPLKSIAIPNIGRIEPKGLVLVIGPNSAGKTQFLRDIQGRILGQARKLVVCDEIEVSRPPSLDTLLELLFKENHIRRRLDEHNNAFIEPTAPHFGGSQSSWSLNEVHVKEYFVTPTRAAGSSQQDGQTDKFLEHFGRSFIASLFLDRRLSVTNTVDNFDYETAFPSNELQSLYVEGDAKQVLADEARKVFGKAIWVDNTRANKLCLRVGSGPDVPAAADRLEPVKMKQYRLIEEEGDGLKSYIAICLTLLLGRRPVVLIDEPEMCLHPPQAFALGQFIGRHGVSPDHMTFVATHSSHVLRGVIETAEKIDVIRLSRAESHFVGRRVSHETLKTSTEKPSTKLESILDGLFAEAVTVVESEGDRLVYGTTWGSVAKEYRHDMHFVSVGGLGGMADPCILYKNLEIPVCVAADLDAIRELGTFESILKALAPEEAARELRGDCQRIIDAVKALGPIYDETETRQRLADIATETLNWKDGSQLKRIRKTLSELSEGLSETSRLKKGLESLNGESVHQDLNAFLRKCQSHGVFLVPVGELEDWVPELTRDGPSKKKKSEWANYAANRIREAIPRTDGIWGFIRQIASLQRDQGARLADCPSPVRQSSP